ncbi:hypothetical protein JCM33374_g4514 [Metschnikowia sp. JCM 33374]|nr:hypothetical protein JCM33374_g4514 [Metschnikowia sp. JCM 33374]
MVKRYGDPIVKGDSKKSHLILYHAGANSCWNSSAILSIVVTTLTKVDNLPYCIVTLCEALLAGDTWNFPHFGACLAFVEASPVRGERWKDILLNN